jgi:hypothetical protein
VKKCCSIVFLLIFFLAQYGKLVSYSYCRIKADSQSVSCDCEKILSDQNTHAKAQVILKEKPEEVYVKTNFFSYSHTILNLTQPYSVIQNSLSEGYHPALFHPPAV